MEINKEQLVEEQGGGKKTLWIIGGIILTVMIIGLVYGATQRTLNKVNQAEDETDSVLLNNQVGGADTKAASDGEVLGVSEQVEVPVTVKGLDVVNLQTFPQKVEARITYELPQSCAKINTPQVSRSGKIFTITIAGYVLKDQMCASVITSGEIVVALPVTDISAGTYTVTSASFSKKFTFSNDNEIQFSGDK